MKKIFLSLMMLFAFAISCSSDDDTSSTPQNNDDEIGDDTVGTAIIRITEVNADQDWLVLANLGDGTLDIGDYFMCLGPGTYAQVSGLTTDDTNIAPNGSITLSYDMNPSADGLSVFSTNTFTSVDPTVLIDYVQWGAGDQPRADQAVEAGRWDDVANFVADGSPYLFNGSSTNFGSNFWEGTEAAGEGVLRILTVDTDTDQVTLTNLGGSSIDVGDYFLCLGPGTYQQIGNVANGSTMLAPDSTITLDYDMNPTQDGLSIFSTNSFSSSDPSILLDYVQWGAGDQPRVDQAVAAGRWDDVANSVADGSPYLFNGSSTNFGSDFWEGTEAAGEGVLRILAVDTDTDQVTLTNLGGSSIDVGDYFLCLGPGTYQQIGNVANGSTMLAPDSTITLDYDMNPTQDGLSIFATNSFGSSDPAVLLDYVQWGGANQARVSQAVTAGRWDDVANFVAEGSPYNFIGGSEDLGVSFWE